jgi:hypothetical protein
MDRLKYYLGHNAAMCLRVFYGRTRGNEERRSVMGFSRAWSLWCATLLAAPSVASAAERTPTITGDGWVALGIIVVLVAVVALLIRGTLSVSDRDTSDDDGGGVLPFFPDDDDDEERPRRKR